MTTTPAHGLVDTASDPAGGTTQRVVIVGDLMHSAIQVARPDWRFFQDVDPDLAQVTRATMLADLCVKIAGVRVLVVDDEPDARGLVQRLLEDCDAVVATAASAADACEQLRDGRFDVLVSDVGMPGEDGYSLMRRVRALSGLRGRIAAVALTAHARPEDRARALEAGFQWHIAKPIDPAELVAAIAALASHRGDPVDSHA